MKLFYYSIGEGKDWDKTEQHSVNANDWAEFAMFCKGVSTATGKEVRGCTSPGYRNQGHYFWEKKVNQLVA